MDRRVDLTENFMFRKRREDEPRTRLSISNQTKRQSFKKMYLRGKLVSITYPWETINKLHSGSRYGLIPTGTKEQFIRERRGNAKEQELYEGCERCGKKLIPWDRRYLLCSKCDSEIGEPPSQFELPFKSVIEDALIKRNIRISFMNESDNENGLREIYENAFRSVAHDIEFF